MIIHNNSHATVVQYNTIQYYSYNKVTNGPIISTYLHYNPYVIHLDDYKHESESRKLFNLSVMSIESLITLLGEENPFQKKFLISKIGIINCGTHEHTLLCLISFEFQKN